MLNEFPAIVYKTLVEQHLSDLEAKTLRLVSKETRSWIDTAIAVLQPRDFSKSQVSTNKRHARSHACHFQLCLSDMASSASNLGVMHMFYCLIWCCL